MHLLKTTAIASSLVAASFVMGTGIAKAQVADTATVTLSGTIDDTCVFATAVTSNGVLVLAADSLATLTSTNTAGGGAPATINVTCNADFSLTTGNLQQTVGTEDLTAGTNTIAAAVGGVSSAITATGVEQLVAVDLTLATGATIPADTYTFTVDVTATPD